MEATASKLSQGGKETPPPDFSNSTSILNYICCSTSTVSVTSLPVTCSTTRFILLLNVPNLI
jgi:hypothetical protein